MLNSIPAFNNIIYLINIYLGISLLYSQFSNAIYVWMLIDQILCSPKRYLYFPILDPSVKMNAVEV